MQGADRSGSIRSVARNSNMHSFPADTQVTKDRLQQIIE
jgi:hypothetical protein